jgi:hypothetical protein
MAAPKPSKLKGFWVYIGVFERRLIEKRINKAALVEFAAFEFRSAKRAVDECTSVKIYQLNILVVENALSECDIFDP